MKTIYLLLCVALSVLSGTPLSSDLRDVIAHPEHYEGRHIQLDGIARVQGPFFLFADMAAAAETDTSKALFIRTDSFSGRAYRELDRQWVRVTGVISLKPHRGTVLATGLLLDQAELLRDRSAPRIKDSTVLGIFQNATTQPLAIYLRPPSPGVATEFFLGPGEADEIELCEGYAVVSLLEGPVDVSFDLQKVGRRIATGEISFRGLLPSDYEYSPGWSDKRTLYYRITNDRIELVPASEAKGWAEAAGRKIP